MSKLTKEIERQDKENELKKFIDTNFYIMGADKLFEFILLKSFKKEYEEYRKEEAAKNFLKSEDSPKKVAFAENLDKHRSAILNSSDLVSKKVNQLKNLLEMNLLSAASKNTNIKGKLVTMIEDELLWINLLQNKIKMSNVNKSAAAAPVPPITVQYKSQQDAVRQNVASQKPTTPTVEEDPSLSKPPPTRKRHS